MDSNTHFARDCIATADKYIERLLVNAENEDPTTILNNSIAAIIVSRCRKHIRTKNKTELYEFVSNVPSLKKKRASTRRAISQACYELLN